MRDALGASGPFVVSNESDIIRQYENWQAARQRIFEVRKAYNKSLISRELWLQDRRKQIGRAHV